MNLLVRILQRIVILIVTLLAIWLIVTQVFNRLDEYLPLVYALILTYILSAYLILPSIIHLTALITRKGRIPRFTRASDGLPADPVNIILLGSRESLLNAFEKAGWYKADSKSARSAWKMLVALFTNSTYPKAPFSSLFLFNRKQDIGFEQPIGNNIRQRNHVRFWAVNMDRLPDPLDLNFWTKKHEVNYSEPLMWIGASTKDTGFGIASLTYQITHAVDANVDEERDYLVSSLQNTGVIKDVKSFDSGTFKVGKYTSDGKIVVATLN